MQYQRDTDKKLDQVLHSQRRESHAQSAALTSAHLGRQAALAGSEMIPPLNSVTRPVFLGHQQQHIQQQQQQEEKSLLLSTTEQQQQQQLYSNSSSRQDSDITHEFLHEYIKTIKVSVADLWNAWQASTLEFPGTRARVLSQTWQNMEALYKRKAADEVCTSWRKKGGDMMSNRGYVIMEFERAIRTSSQGERRAIETVQHNVNTLGGTAPNGGGTIYISPSIQYEILKDATRTANGKSKKRRRAATS